MVLRGSLKVDVPPYHWRGLRVLRKFGHAASTFCNAARNSAQGALRQTRMEPRSTSSTQAQVQAQVGSARPAAPSRSDSGTGFGELLLRFAAPIAALAVVSTLVGFE